MATNKKFDVTDFLADSRGQKIEITHVPSGRSLEFKAYIINFTDDYSSEWTKDKVFGRMDPIPVFQGTERIINFSWEIVASSLEEAEQNMAKIQELMMFTYPSYEGLVNNATTIKGAPILLIKFGNWIQNPEGAPLTGFVDGFSFAPKMDEGFFDPPGIFYPQAVEVNCAFNVLHTGPLGWTGDSWRAGTGPYGIKVNEVPVSEVNSFSDKTDAQQDAAGAAILDSSPPGEGASFDDSYDYWDGSMGMGD